MCVRAGAGVDSSHSYVTPSPRWRAMLCRMHAAEYIAMFDNQDATRNSTFLTCLPALRQSKSPDKIPLDRMNSLPKCTRRQALYDEAPQSQWRMRRGGLRNSDVDAMVAVHTSQGIHWNLMEVRD